MLALTLRENDGGVEIVSHHGEVLRIQVIQIRSGSVRIGFTDDDRNFEITREKAIVKFPKQPNDDGPKAA